MSVDDLIDQFVDDLDFDALIEWADILDVEVNYPPLDDMWPEWDGELREEVGIAVRKIIETAKTKQEKMKNE